MSSVPASPYDQQRADTFQGLVTQLRSAGVQILHTGLDQVDLATWDNQARVLSLRSGAPIEDRLWVLMDLLKLLCIGPHATDGAIPEPRRHLYAVPAEG